LSASPKSRAWARQVDEHDGYVYPAERSGGDQSLVPADHLVRLAVHYDWLDWPVRAHAAHQDPELIVRDPARIGRIRMELVERDVLDSKRGPH
jgi:hypothetical protein